MMNAESFAQFIMLAIKKNNKIYVILSYQMLFIENLIKLVSREVARCNTFQIKKSNVLKFLKDFAQMFFEMLLNSLNTHD